METHPTNNARFVTSSKGQRPAVNSKIVQNINNLSTTSNFNRIYTPQNCMRGDKKLSKRLRKTSSKTKTMINTELDLKQSVDPINISTNKASNMTLNSSSIHRKQKFRVYSAHPTRFGKLQPMHKYIKSTDIDNSKLTSISTKDWKMFSVREGDQIEEKPVRNCCSAKKTKDRLFRINHARRLYRQRQEVYENARHIKETLVESSKAEMLIPHGLKSSMFNMGINSSFSNSFMNAMFKDTSLDAAQRQKETVLRDQQK